MTVPQHFNNFLLKQGVKTRFVRNFKRHYQFYLDTDNFFEYTSPRDYITSAFIWKYEECEFWHKLSQKWNKYIERNGLCK